MAKFRNMCHYKAMPKERLRGQPFSVFPQQRKNGLIWYVQFRLPEPIIGRNGKLVYFSTAKSTGQTTKSAALTWVRNYLSNGRPVTKSNVLFKDFAANFFDPSSEYAKQEKLHSKRFSENRLKAKADKLRLHILPYFQNYKLTMITADAIGKFQQELAEKGLSSFTCNDTVNILLIILKQAYKSKYIQAVPEVEPVVLPAKERGSFSVEEVKKLLSMKWDNYPAFIGNLIAASTGMREGEIVALQNRDIFPDHIVVVHSWDTRSGKLKAPKNGKARVVPLANKVYAEILKLQAAAIWKGDSAFLFQSEKPEKPMYPENLRDELYRQLEKIGIDAKEREKRQLCFHSWRHFFNSLLINSNISKFKVQALIGHSSDEMSLNYYHADEMLDVKLLQDKFFD